MKFISSELTSNNRKLQYLSRSSNGLNFLFLFFWSFFGHKWNHLQKNDCVLYEAQHWEEMD